MQPPAHHHHRAFERRGRRGLDLAPAGRRRVLGVWAHPDDETYLSAGLMGRIVDAGGSVTVVSATRGEQGSADPLRRGTSAFAAHRESELRAALGEVGVDDVRFLGLPDGECAQADPAGPIGQLTLLVDELQPDLVVTFGPDGITWHPDHQAVSSWMTAAWQLSHHASASRAELLYATLWTEAASRHRELHDRLGIFRDFGPGRPATTPTGGLALRCSLSRSELRRKRRALAGHASQTDELAALMGEEAFTTWWRDEAFRRPTRRELANALAKAGTALAGARP